jgi:hypothetical protein
MVIRYQSTMQKSKSLEERRLGMKEAWSALEKVPAYKENGFYLTMFENMQTTADKSSSLYRMSK